MSLPNDGRPVKRLNPMCPRRGWYQNPCIFHNSPPLLHFVKPPYGFTEHCRDMLGRENALVDRSLRARLPSRCLFRGTQVCSTHRPEGKTQTILSTSSNTCSLPLIFFLPHALVTSRCPHTSTAELAFPCTDLNVMPSYP